MKTRLAMLLGAVLLLAGCAATPDYGYGYGYASNDYGACGWGGGCGYAPYAYEPGPSFSLNLNFADRDRADRDRWRQDEHRGDVARAGGGGERHDAQVGRGGPPQVRHEGGDHGRDHDHDR